jgi:CBS domain-containing protein
MATKDPNSRLTESDLNSPDYLQPNGATGQRGNGGATVSGASTARSGAGVRPDASAGEKIGRFFRRAMDRLAGRDEEDVRREDDWKRREREHEMRDRGRERERQRAGESTWQSGRPSPRERGQSEWRDLGRSPDDRNPQYRAGPSGETGGSYERYSGGPQASGNMSYGQGAAGRPYGQSQGSYGQSGFGGQLGEERDESRYARGGGQWQESNMRPSYAQPSQGYEGRGGQVPEQRGPGFPGDPGRDDWHRSQERWGERQSGATGMSWRGRSFEPGPDNERASESGEIFRDRDRGQGRRFWQREPLAARDVMTRNPRTVTRQGSIREAAIVMRDENCGVVPVVDAAGRLEGILTDRDNVVRGVVKENFHQLRVEDVMTDDVSAVTEDEPLTSVLDLMGRKQIRRVPVVDRDDRLLGIISMADIANRADYDEDLQDAFERISSRRSFWSVFS